MKNLFIAFSLILFVTSCDIIVVEPQYDIRELFVGRYDIEEYSATYDYSTVYPISINKSSHNYDEIIITNFYDVNISIYAWVEGNKLTIPLQEVNLYEIEGTGTLRDHEIHFQYSVRDLYSGGTTDFCQAVAW